MPKRPGRLTTLVAGVSVLALAGAVGYLLLPPRQTDTISLPPPDASPEQVVTVYLDALNAHDCDTAEALMTAGAEGSARAWCDDVASLTDVDVEGHVLERPEYSGHSDPEEVVYVPVTFDLTWRPLHDDGSLAEGPTTWGYLLVRDADGSPWRIFGQGRG